MTNAEVNFRAWQMVADSFIGFLPVLMMLVFLALLLGAMSMGATGSHRGGWRRGKKRGKQKIDVYAHLR